MNRRFRPFSYRWRPAGRRTLCGLALLLAVAPAVVNAAGKKPKKTDGPYNVTVGGSYTGQGRAVVAGRTILITAQIRNESGEVGLLIGTDLVIDGDHFHGAGLVFGRPATFTGRLDGYAGDKHFRGARVLCSVVDRAGGRTGRVAGVLR